MAVTLSEVTKLYVATFNRAPDAEGINYWANSGMSIENIAQSFFDQSETQILYPAGTANSSFVTSVYANLFNRAPDTDGLNYWVQELDSGNISKQNFILAVINGAQNTEISQDATILTNKQTVGLYFIEQGLNDITLARDIMEDIDATQASIDTSLRLIEAESISLETSNIQLISNSLTGVLGNGNSDYPAISADGRYVTFGSLASTLVIGDTNGSNDIFLKDTQTGAITIVSSSSTGVLGNGTSSISAISDDGRYVTFISDASNLVTGDTNGSNDIFLKDTQTGTTTLISVSSNGVLGNGWSTYPAVSSDGRYVTFMSDASNLVTGDTNGLADIFLKDTQNGSLTLISSSSAGVLGNNFSFYPAISADGRYVTFVSDASNLIAGDTNNLSDVFLKDTQTGALTAVSTRSDGVIGNGSSSNPAISLDGNYVTFMSDASNLVTSDTNGSNDIFLKNTQTGALTAVSTSSNGILGNGSSYDSTVSSDGRYVTFTSEASNLVADDTNNRSDIFLKDTQTGAIAMVSKNAAGESGDWHSFHASISSDGNYITFVSIASNLVSTDTNNIYDIFLVENPFLATTSPTTIAPSGLDLSSSDDTGISSTDNITKTTSALTITGTATAGSTVKLYDTNGTTLLGTATATSSGTFSTDISLSAGTHSITAKATNTSGTTSSASSPLSITVDTTAPTAHLTSITDNVGSVTGILSSGATTDDTSLAMIGTCESGSTVAIYNGATLLGNATVSNTSWSYTATVTNGSTYQLNAKETDKAGNASTATGNFTVTCNTNSASLLSLAEDKSTANLLIDEASLLPATSTIVKSLDSSYYWDDSSITYNYNTSIPTYYTSLEDTLGWQRVSSTVQSVINSIMSSADGLIAPSITKTNSIGNISFNTITLSGGENGHAYYPSDYSNIGGDIFLSNQLSLDEVEIGTYDFMTIIHELGHALGLKHPFEDGTTLSTSQDHRVNTVMSYTNYKYLVPEIVYSANRMSGSYEQLFPQTFMVYDIAALQSIYGADTTTNTGNTTYTYGTTPFYSSIWDAGGIDTLDLTQTTHSNTIKLTSGNYSNINYASVATQIAQKQAQYEVEADTTYYNSWIASVYNDYANDIYTGENALGIAYGTIIENAMGGSGSDSFYDNSVDNILQGNAGNDIFYLGEGGFDTIIGGAGTDKIVLSLTKNSVTMQAQSTGETLLVANDFALSLTGVETIQFSDQLYTLVA